MPHVNVRNSEEAAWQKKNVLLTGRTPEQDQAHAGLDKGGGKKEMGQKKKGGAE